MAEALAYPFLFIAIFFESFILVTFLSAPARAARTRPLSTKTPTVSIIVPCFNEEHTVGRTVTSLLALDYPKNKLSLVLVDNASSDGTAAVLAAYAKHPQITVLYEAKQGKHNAVNAGLAASTAEIVGCLDADSFVEPQALREIIGSFDNPQVGASTAAMSVHEPKNLLQHMQNAEYIYGIALRHVMSTVRGVHVTPGPFSLYRSAVLQKVGGFRHAYQTEDLEMCLRLQKAGYLIENAPRARVYTKTPRTIAALLKQRVRWTSGFLRNVLFDYRDLVGSQQHGALGALVLPIAFPALFGAITMFFVSISLFVSQTLHAYQVRSGIPLSYAYMPHNAFFDWFYTPGSIYLLLALVTLVGMTTLMFLGRAISKTPAVMTPAILSYLFLYGFIAPLWLMRSVADVALHKNRAWR